MLSSTITNASNSTPTSGLLSSAVVEDMQDPQLKGTMFADSSIEDYSDRIPVPLKPSQTRGGSPVDNARGESNDVQLPVLILEHDVTHAVSTARAEIPDSDATSLPSSPQPFAGIMHQFPAEFESASSSLGLDGSAAVTVINSEVDTPITQAPVLEDSQHCLEALMDPSTKIDEPPTAVHSDVLFTEAPALLKDDPEHYEQSSTATTRLPEPDSNTTSMLNGKDVLLAEGSKVQDRDRGLRHSSAPSSFLDAGQNAVPVTASEAQDKIPTAATSEVDQTPLSVSPTTPTQTKDFLWAELKAMKIVSIQARNASLELEIAAKRAKLEAVARELKNPAAETVRKHIKLLHEYNDMRDVGQGLLGMIADSRGVRVGEIYSEFGVGLND